MYSSLFDTNTRAFIQKLPYISPLDYALTILKCVPKQTDNKQREKHLAFEMRERFGVRVMNKFMEIYRKQWQE
jgi:hypothetical protein